MTTINWHSTDAQTYPQWGLESTADYTYLGNLGSVTWKVPYTTPIWPSVPDGLPYPYTLDDVQVDGDIRAPHFEARIKREIMAEMIVKVRKMVLLLMEIHRWFPPDSLTKKYTDGVFCFVCGAPSRKGLEGEECDYCGH